MYRCVLATTALMIVCSGATAAPRDVQMRSVNITTSVIELHNFSTTDTEPLSGWRFCSADDNEVLRYTNSFGTASLAPGASLFVHFANDAPADPAHINASALGGFVAGPLDAGPYGIALYFAPVNFSNGNTQADYMQWNIGGADNVTADERADEAQSGGVWTDQTAWISTAATTTVIRLTDASGAVNHGPADYEVADESFDCNENGFDDFFDIQADPSLDLNTNGLIDACEPVPTGACCITDIPARGLTGPTDCMVLTEEDCLLIDGVYQGDDTTCDVCFPATGACCLEIPERGVAGPACEILTEDECLLFSGTYQGDDTTCESCSPVPLTGACCLFAPGQAEDCFITDEIDCTSQNGAYQGDLTDCEVCPVICPCDWNGSMVIDSNDFFDFLAEFFLGDADYDNNGSTNSDDFFSFLNCFFDPGSVGC